MLRQAELNTMNKAFGKAYKGISDTSSVSTQGVEKDGQEKDALQPLIINGVEVKLHQAI